MNVRIKPSKLIGRVNAPSSKSFSHRMLIAAALAGGVSEISNISASEDIDATVGALAALGAKIFREGNTYTVMGIKTPAASAVIDCRESGSTMRFIIPIAAALGCSCEFRGKGKLPERPITPYIRELGKNGAVITKTEGVMPFVMNGTLKGGDYVLEGDISSQFITGLLFALPLCSGNSVIRLASKLESKPYADMTVEALSRFGITIDESEDKDGLPVYRIRGGQKYRSADVSVEGDYSQAAFYFAANALGSEIKVDNLSEKSVQGDKKILEIIGGISYNKINDSGLRRLPAFSADVSDIPDLVPILAVLGCFTDGVSRITGAKRLKIKESNRLEAISSALGNIGGKITVGDDSLEIEPVDGFHGGVIDGCNDHRIVMASAIASTMADGEITITGAEAVAKSYPDFWTDFASLGGNIEFERT
ncbi:MAG: 3-phosphoshikimate 1-carboxyvinyltransferase [Oscillospiraceae bacterium]|jgi:3-phosphoshikimate 1-carboxyvinyltransferase|nr:3-phosphoshikimate 1-carboxyvinyltransferase [Oscillospiraceae bacterium]